jgi:hypothetical protein
MAFKTGAATSYINALDILVSFALAKKTVSAVVAAPGANNSPGDILTVVGGTPETAATFTVATVDVGGGVLTVTPLVTGLYCNGSEPANNVATTTNGAGDNACTLTVTWAGALGWTQQRNTVYSGSDKEVILLGDGGGAYSIYVGIRSFNDAAGSGAYNWELVGLTGYAGGSAWAAQPGISPGRYDLAQRGAYVPLRNAAITYWFFVTNRRIICVFKVGTVYTNMYLGLANPFGTASEYPYPIAVFGCCGTWNTLYSTATQGISGLVDPVNITNNDDGVAYIRDSGGIWRSVVNTKMSGANRSAVKVVNVWPVGMLDYVSFPAEDCCVANNIAFDKYAPVGAAGTAPAYKLYPTPDSGGNKVVPFPNFIAMNTPLAVLAELDNVHWISACAPTANIVSEDTITIGSDVYLCFQQGSRTDFYSYFAIKRE